MTLTTTPGLSAAPVAKEPKLSQTSGTVSLRAETWDDAGNRVE